MKRGQDALIIERQQKVWELHKAGVSLRQIGVAVGVSYEQVRKDIKAVLREVRQETTSDATKWRTLELDRLETLQAKWWSKAIKVPVQQQGQSPPDISDNLSAANLVLKIMERRAKLLGIDTPTNQKIDVTSNGKPLVDTRPVIILDFGGDDDDNGGIGGE